MEDAKESIDMIDWESIDEVEDVETLLNENPEMACMMSRKHSAT